MNRSIMQIIPAKLAITNFEELCEHTYQNHEPCVISRFNQHDVILMSVEDFNGWQETHYLLSNPYNAQRLIRSLECARNGEAKPRELIE